jgi:hypothetical protein
MSSRVLSSTVSGNSAEDTSIFSPSARRSVFREHDSPANKKTPQHTAKSKRCRIFFSKPMALFKNSLKNLPREQV